MVQLIARLLYPPFSSVIWQVCACHDDPYLHNVPCLSLELDFLQVSLCTSALQQHLILIVEDEMTALSLLVLCHQMLSLTRFESSWWNELCISTPSFGRLKIESLCAVWPVSGHRESAHHSIPRALCSMSSVAPVSYPTEAIMIYRWPSVCDCVSTSECPLSANNLIISFPVLF